MNRSRTPYFFLGLAALIALTAIVVWRPRLAKRANHRLPEDRSTSIPTTPATPANTEKSPSPRTIEPNHYDPAALVAKIAKAIEDSDLDGLSLLIPKKLLDPATIDHLKQLSTPPLRLRKTDPIREIGELEMNNHSRWALNLDDHNPGDDRIILDLRRIDGKWVVAKITLPIAGRNEFSQEKSVDSLGIADGFLQAILKQDCESARRFADSATISDAKLAALCILFEEGHYRLRKSKPLRAIFQRDDTAGYLANVQSSDESENAQIAMTLRHLTKDSAWIVSEINLDQLLADYTKRIAGGDSYYTPLVRNPTGGDTLAIYFDFDQDQMTPRTRRQLEIVTRILLSDPVKQITLSGHTDALGTKDYNNGLSGRRASIVCEFLIKSGVAQNQIVMVAKGDSQPRRPNVMENGKDNPEGRRANRRTEIYLDF